MRVVQRLKSKLAQRSSSKNRKSESESETPPPSTTSTAAAIEPRIEKHGLFPLTSLETLDDSTEFRTFSVDIVAIHGINGNAFSTWTHDQNGVLWLRDLLPKLLPGCRVFTYGYPSKIFSDSMASIHDCAIHLLASIQAILGSRDENHNRPLMFICHSLGGIVFKQALVVAYEAAGRYDAILQSIVGVVFLGTPHSGSSVADLGNIVARIVNTLAIGNLGSSAGVVKIDMLEYLRSKSEKLLELSAAARFGLGQMSVVTCYETRPVPQLRRIVVDQASATLGISNERLIPLYEDHKSICRFPSDESVSYQLISAEIHRIASCTLQADSLLEKLSSHSSNIILSDLERTCVRLLNENDANQEAEEPPNPAPGTCEWIRSHKVFISWIEKTTAAFLWLTGHPGSGKTTLMWSLRRFLEQAQTNSKDVIVYFCQNRTVQTNGPAILIGLILQMVNLHRSTLRYLRQSFEMQGPGLIGSFSSLWKLFVKLVGDPKMKNVYIILDALDECESVSCQKLLQNISDLLESPGLATRVKFLATSRPLLREIAVDIEKGFQSKIPIDASQEGYARDLQAYIHQRVTQISQARQYKNEVESFLYDTLVARAGNTFLWIQMVLETIERSVWSSLKEIKRLVFGMPAGLASTYQRLLLAIPVEVQDSALKLLTILLGCRRTLLLEELNIAFTLSSSYTSSHELLPDMQDAMAYTLRAILGPLVRVYESGSPPKEYVTLIHQSFREFVFAGRNQGAESLQDLQNVTAETAALYMASICVQYLLLAEFQEDLFLDDTTRANATENPDDYDNLPMADIYGEDEYDTGDLANDIVFADPEVRLSGICKSIKSAYTFYDYAASNWTRHLAQCDSIIPDQLLTSAKSLLDYNTVSCRNWLQYNASETTSSPIGTNGTEEPLVLAAKLGLLGVLRDTLATTNPSQSVKDVSLYWTCRLGHDRLVSSLLLAGAKQNTKQMDRQSGLTAAAEYGHVECVEALLDDAATKVSLLGRKGRCALSFACGNGNIEIFDALMRRAKGDVNVPDNTGATPLFWATSSGQRQIVMKLLKTKSININHVDNTGRTALSWAAAEGVYDSAEILLKQPGIDANIQDKKGRSALSWAAGIGHFDIVECLLESPLVDLETTDVDDRNLISWASGGGHHTVLEALLSRGCPGVDAEDIDGWTPLFWAIHVDSPRTIEVLIETSHVDVNRQDRAQRTALSWAMEHGHRSMVTALLQAGADPNLESSRGETPQDIARRFGRYDLANLVAFEINYCH